MEVTKVHLHPEKLSISKTSTIGYASELMLPFHAFNSCVNLDELFRNSTCRPKTEDMLPKVLILLRNVGVPNLEAFSSML